MSPGYSARIIFGKASRAKARAGQGLSEDKAMEIVIDTRLEDIGKAVAKKSEELTETTDRIKEYLNSFHYDVIEQKKTVFVSI